MDPNLTHDLDTVVARATPEGEGGLAVVRLSGPQALAIATRVFRGAGYGRGSGEPGPGSALGDGPIPGTTTGPTTAPVGGSGPTPRRAVYGIFHEPIVGQPHEEQALAVIDESLALWLPGPHSYTGEDTVEFFCHGGRQVTAAVVRACQRAGAVAAAPGEFTRRAFLNGRLSLDQAEAVADLIQAGSEQAARAAVAQLRGGLDAELGALEWPLLDLLVRLEGSLEFSDDDSDEAVVDAAEIRLVLAEALDGVDQLLALAPAGRLLRDGVHVALAGAPNAGKSSLFNRLVGSDRALVDAEPGTTRDIVTAPVRRGGRLYVFHDTAGLREPAGRVESMGIARAREAADQADLVLVLAAVGDGVVVWPEVGGWGDGVAAAGSTCAGASGGASGGEEAGPTCAGASSGATSGASAADQSGAISGARPPALFVLTKCDLVSGAGRDGADRATADTGACATTCAGASPHTAIATSSLTGAGVEDLWAAIEHQVAAWRLDEAASLGVVLNERHRQRLLECRDELAQLLDLYRPESAPGSEVAGTLLASLLARLGEISGRVFTEQMLDSIFKRFCVGK
ncbi:MAG: tRNA modification GTPase [bacterium]|nr:tRNA modification GTPase [bacterium]